MLNYDHSYTENDIKISGDRESQEINILGKLESIKNLPNKGEYGDAYVFKGDIYVWTGKEWKIHGSITKQSGSGGPVGPTGTKGRPDIGAVKMDDGKFYISVVSKKDKLLNEATKDEIKTYFCDQLEDLIKYDYNNKEMLSKILNALVNSIIDSLMPENRVNIITRDLFDEDGWALTKNGNREIYCSRKWTSEEDGPIGYPEISELGKIVDFHNQRCFIAKIDMYKYGYKLLSTATERDWLVNEDGWRVSKDEGILLYCTKGLKVPSGDIEKDKAALEYWYEDPPKVGMIIENGYQKFIIAKLRPMDYGYKLLSKATESELNKGKQYNDRTKNINK